ncbi:MAG: sigma 54-interacting transcriptional regulator, partial [Candidatus Competibacterales bacterium]|nr:sigma 54-interacting transcriptional regulator [Candidatus Competibacterales bacterium]
IVRLSESFEFVDVDADYLLALDDDARLLGFNHQGRRLLCRELGIELSPAELLGRRFEDFFACGSQELSRFDSARAADQRILRTRPGDRPLFALITPPPAVPRRRQPESGRAALPPALAALSGGDPVMDEVLRRAARLAESRIGILLTGETGTGKELLAQALHEVGPRAGGPFVAVNCAALPESLIESELFGYAPGSFTGAHGRGRRGLIQEADGGTLFLDEIGDMPALLQTRLLRVLSEQEVLPVGARQAIKVDIRVIAATHCDLPARVARGLFRDDLYYRLNGAVLELPPLRRRRDLAQLARCLIARDCKQDPPPTLTPAALQRLQAHRWPGNIRELRNVLHYACALGDGRQIGPEDLPDWLGGSATPAQAPDDLYRTLSRHRWNISAAARELGVCRATIYRRMQRRGIVPPHRI